ncbi:MAG: hypothetical protein RIQ59_539 [Bacteroidota bacterium]|jgi:hypothetical protein
MNLHNYEKASEYEVIEWLKQSKDLNLTDQQKSNLYNQEIIRFSPFEFYKQRERISNVWIRLSIIFYPIVWLLLFLALPFKFLIKGSWGYRTEDIKWFYKWGNNLGI